MKKILLITLSTLALSGCVMVPKTVITGSIGGKPFSFSGPKDCSLGMLTVKADTNGSVSLVISNLQTKMNPDVITTTGAAQAQVIQAAADAGAKIAGAIPK